MCLLVKFLAKRTAVLAVILAAAAMLFDNLGMVTSMGIILGAFLSIYRIRMFGTVLNGLALCGGSGKKQAVYQVLSYISVFAVLTVTVLLDTRLFIGMAAGLLLVTPVIMINAVTEKAGVTHNNWGCEADYKDKDGGEAVSWKE